MSWTTAQVLALAPDASSASSGKGLSNLSQWVSSGRTEQAVWGECKGSGKLPYQTRIDLSSEMPSFKCSCPSRKFPCKHGIGLMLMYAAAPGQLPEATPPGWVQEWLDSRGAKQEAKAEKAAREDTPEDIAKREKAAHKRLLEKDKRLGQGLEEFGLWLRDVVRGGIAPAQGWSYDKWEMPAKRLVDAGAPGIARRVGELAGVPSSGAGGQGRLLERLGQLHLLVEGYRNREKLPEGTRADVLQTLGQYASSEEVLAGSPVMDTWLVCGVRFEDVDNLLERRSYLRGLNSGQDALILEFSFGGKGFETAYPPGHALEGELCFYPSARRFRALSRNLTDKGQMNPGTQASGVSELLERHTDALSLNPWFEKGPALLGQVQISRDAVLDARGDALPLSSNFPHLWPLLALSGGQSVTLFGEWNGQAFFPLSLWSDLGFYALGGKV